FVPSTVTLRSPVSTTCLHITFISCHLSLFSLSFFFNDTATTEIYTLSLHDALPISRRETNQALPGDIAAFPDTSHLAGCDSPGNQCWIGSDGQRRRHSQRNRRRSNGRGDHPAETKINQQSHRSGSSDFIGRLRLLQF